jgi:hypothetical protein
LAGQQNEGAVVSHRFNFDYLVSFVGGLENRCISSIDSLCPILDLEAAPVTDNHGIPTLRDDVIIGLVLLEIEVEEVSGDYGLNRSLDTEDLSSKYFSSHIIILIYWDLRAVKLLIPRITILVLLVKVEPELEPVCWLSKADRDLRVHDALSGGHPLDISWADHSFVALEVLM